MKNSKIFYTISEKTKVVDTTIDTMVEPPLGMNELCGRKILTFRTEIEIQKKK